jgi:LAS superfamily LD-carboxypeptidase LdcB
VAQVFYAEDGLDHDGTGQCDFSQEGHEVEVNRSTHVRQRLRRITRCKMLTEEAASWFEQMASACEAELTKQDRAQNPESTTSFKLVIDDGFRSAALQRERFLNGSDPAAPPGTSDHELGIAVDIRMADVYTPKEQEFFVKQNVARAERAAARAEYAEYVANFYEACSGKNKHASCAQGPSAAPALPPIPSLERDYVKIGNWLRENASRFNFYHVNPIGQNAPTVINGELRGEPWHYAYRRPLPRP